eukprot:Clim_evm47s150 gene=Clim_evmTU47s150
MVQPTVGKPTTVSEARGPQTSEQSEDLISRASSAVVASATYSYEQVNIVIDEYTQFFFMIFLTMATVPYIMSQQLQSAAGPVREATEKQVEVVREYYETRIAPTFDYLPGLEDLPGGKRVKQVAFLVGNYQVPMVKYFVTASLNSIATMGREGRDLANQLTQTGIAVLSVLQTEEARALIMQSGRVMGRVVVLMQTEEGRRLVISLSNAMIRMFELIKTDEAMGVASEASKELGPMMDLMCSDEVNNLAGQTKTLLDRLGRFLQTHDKAIQPNQVQSPQSAQTVPINYGGGPRIVELESEFGSNVSQRGSPTRSFRGLSTTSFQSSRDDGSDGMDDIFIDDGESVFSRATEYDTVSQVADEQAAIIELLTKMKTDGLIDDGERRLLKRLARKRDMELLVLYRAKMSNAGSAAQFMEDVREMLEDREDELEPLRKPSKKRKDSTSTRSLLSMPLFIGGLS